MRRRVFSILMAMILISIPLVVVGATSAFSANYYPESPIQFTKGHDIVGHSNAPFVYNDNKFVALLGTLELTVTNPPATLKELSLLKVTSDTHFMFSGLRENTNWIPHQSEFSFHLETVSFVNASSTPNRISAITQTVVPITNPGTIGNVQSLTIEIYLVSNENSSVFVPGTVYTHYSGSIGTFNLAVTPTNNIWSDKEYIPITVGPGNTPSDPIPILWGGSSTIPPETPYVDDDHPLLLFLLHIINERTIDLSDAYGTGKTRVARANIEIQNAQTGSEYKVNIKFESTSVSQGSFTLHLDGDHSLYGIPYTLFFKQQEVVPGELILWKHLKPGSTDNNNTKAIKVTGVAQIVAEAAPAGTYSDTITVTIIPVDTI